MSSGPASMMLPSARCSASTHNSLQDSYFQLSLNTPEEDDETMSTKADCEPGSAAAARPATSRTPDPIDPNDPNDLGPTARHLPSARDHQDSVYNNGHRGHNKHGVPQVVPGCSGSGYLPYQPPHGLPAGYSQPTPFPSRAEEEEEEEPAPSSSWLHPSFASGWTTAGGAGFFPNSLPSYTSHKDPAPSYSGDSSASSSSSYSSRQFLSLPGRYSPNPGCSLEQPHSLHSNPPPPPASHNNMYHHTLSPYYCSPPGAACCAQCPADFFNRGGAPMGARPDLLLGPGYHPTYGHHYADGHRLPGAGYRLSGHYSSSKQKNPAYNSPLSLEQRRVFVTYEADNDKHVNEIINFVALLRHNGFDTHIDMFEQHFRSISKIDFMERYLSEKEYLIIIIISPKYHETVTAPPVSLESDERTLNTVYIHKQLQNEFIQNGSKNFRFIPILFPGARKCHVPNWLQNTHVYGWPRDRDDILRRLMRVEKYNPPPIGQLPTIIPIPI